MPNFKLYEIDKPIFTKYSPVAFIINRQTNKQKKGRQLSSLVARHIVKHIYTRLENYYIRNLTTDWTMSKIHHSSVIV
jgi:hypothetical protein